MNDQLRLWHDAGVGLRRDTGIAAAVEHADRDIPDWSDQALTLVRFYAAASLREFMAEDVREWAYASGLPPPPDGRAWGAVMQRARWFGYIKPAGYRAARSSNMSPKVLWTRGATAA